MSDVSLLTTKGDLAVFTTVDTRLPVGTDGQVLSANSAQPSGLEWISGGSGETNTMSNLGVTGADIFFQKSGVDFELRGLIGGTNIELIEDDQNIIINSTGGGSGETNTASNVGTGDGVFKQKTGVDFEFKTLIGGDDLTITNNTNDLTIALDADITLDSIAFNTAASVSHTEGTVYYDGGDHSLIVYNDSSEVTQQIGREFYIRVYNDSGATINNGNVVYISGSEGVEFRPTIALADSDTAATSRVLGLTTHDIENNTFGYVTHIGLVNDLDTSSFSAGDPVYLSGTPGNIQTTPGTINVQIGYVVRSHATLGNIFVEIIEVPESAGGAVGDLAIITDEKASGTDGGTFNAGAWRIRDLNTLNQTGTFCSIASNQFTLTAGKYTLVSLAPGHSVDGHQSRVWNVTDAVVEALGTNSRESSTSQSNSICNASIDITTTKTYRIEHRCETSDANDGFGAANGWGVEVYTTVTVTKIG
jgi:hypothetical protein